MNNVYCQTDDFGLTEDTKYFAKLFTTKTNINKSNFYNDCQIIFSVFHVSSTSGIVAPKKYILTTGYDNAHIVNLIDLTPHVSGITVGYNIDDSGNVVVSGKGSIIGAKLKIKIEYVTTLGMFKFYNCSKFVDDISVITPTNLYKRARLHLINGWVENQYFQNFYEIINGVCYVNLNINSGITTEQIVIADNLPKPKITQQIVVCDSDGVSGVVELTANGHLRVKKLSSTKDTMCTFSYPIKIF